MEHNAEPEAVDLLLEVEDMDQLLQHVNEGNYARTCLYLTSAAAYLAEPDDSAVLHVAFDAYMKVCRALAVDWPLHLPQGSQTVGPLLRRQYVLHLPTLALRMRPLAYPTSCLAHWRHDGAATLATLSV